jgi:hypothetical protein
MLNVKALCTLMSALGMTSAALYLARTEIPTADASCKACGNSGSGSDGPSCFVASRATYYGMRSCYINPQDECILFSPGICSG